MEHGNGISWTFYDSFELLADLDQEWDAFVEKVGGEVFLSFDWQKLWWKYYGRNRELRIFVFRRNTEIVGVLPCFFESFRFGPFETRAVKLVGSDYSITSFTIPIQAEHLKEVISIAVMEMKKHWNFDLLLIGPVSGYACEKHRSAFISAFRSVDSFRLFYDSSQVQTYFTICDNLEKQISSLSKKEKKRMRRMYKQLTASGKETVSDSASRNDCLIMFDKFVKMHQEHWNSSGKSGHFGAWPSAYQFHKELVESQSKRNRLRLLEIRINDRTVAYKYSYRFGIFYHAFLDSKIPYDHKHISLYRLGFGELCKVASSENARYIDSLRGFYEHKMHMGGFTLPIYNFYLQERRISSSIKAFLLRAVSTLYDLLYYKILRVRILHKSRIGKHLLSEFWIRTKGFSFSLKIGKTKG